MLVASFCSIFLETLVNVPESARLLVNIELHTIVIFD